MRCNFYQPLGLQGHTTPHILLTGQDQLVVDGPFRLMVHQHARRMDVHDLAVLDRAVTLAVTLESRRMREEAGRHRLLYGFDVRRSATGLIGIHLDPIA